MIYLDYNATAPLRPSVLAAMQALSDAPLNPASIHASGRAAKKLLEDARATIAQALSAFPNEVLFTGSGSEANNLALRAFAGERALLVAATEHASIAKTAGLLGAATLPVEADGLLDLAALESQLKALDRPALISVMLANNETGVIQPIAEIARIAHAHGALVHCDAVQALGKIPLDWGLLGVDMLTLCAHKCGGPLGVGALLIRSDLPLKPLITGGGQELGRRAGTENIRAIVGFATLLKDVVGCTQAGQWLQWREWLEAELIASINPSPHRGEARWGAAIASDPFENHWDSSPHPNPLSTKKSDVDHSFSSRSPMEEGTAAVISSSCKREGVIFGAEAPRLPNTLQISMPGVRSETQLMHFDLKGFAVSAGSACSSGRVAPSHVLLAMGVKPAVAETAIRLSWGWQTTQDEIEAFAATWREAYYRLSKPKAA